MRTRCADGRMVNIAITAAAAAAAAAAALPRRAPAQRTATDSDRPSAVGNVLVPETALAPGAV